MTKRMLIDATHAEETRVVVLDGNRLDDFDVETQSRRQLKGNIYLAKVVRVEPSLQAAFVEYGGNRHGFLAFGEIHPDYYQIPVADRQRLIEMQEREAEEDEEDAEDAAAPSGDADPRAPSGDREAEAETASDVAPGESAAAEIENGEATRPLANDAEKVVYAPAAERDAPATEAAGDLASADIGQAGDDGADRLPALGVDSAPEMAESAGQSESGEEGGEFGSRVQEVPAEPAPAPELIGGGEAEGVDEVRERRRAARFLRNYKIQEVIRRRQILLVQVVKEERGTKGAALTTYISLAGRYCVLMPNSPRGGGISRKITSAADRRRLKEVTAELEIPRGMGLIVRTAGAARPKPEIKRDCEYLLRLWDEIRDITMQSVAPALIYEEASLIKRAIRDVYSREVDEILVDGEEGWRAARDFMRMLMPANVKKVQLWRDDAPLFSRNGVEAQLDSMLVPTVQLRSGGYLVINQTEALVAIDVNSGRSTRERGIEETAVRTNLEAADEVARQVRLRDLAGLIVIDFIDMEAKKHIAAVERRLKDALKDDRARIQVGHISHFGLMEMSRQRLRPSLAETSLTACPHCGGTGHVRSTESAALHVLRAVEEEGAKRRAAEIMVYVNSATALFILNNKRQRLMEIEQRLGMRVCFTPEDSLSPAQCRIDRLKPWIAPEQPAVIAPAIMAPPAQRFVAAPEPAEAAEPEPADGDEEFEDGEETDAGVTASEGQEGGDEAQRKRRRRRRRRGGRREEGAAEAMPMPPDAEQPEVGELAFPGGVRVVPAEPFAAEHFAPSDEAAPVTIAVPEEPPQTPATDAPPPVPGHDEAGEAVEETAKPKPRTRRGGRRRKAETPAEDAPPLPYSGPTPADPFGNVALDIFDVIEQAIAAQPAAAPEPQARSVEPRIATQATATDMSSGAKNGAVRTDSGSVDASSGAAVDGAGADHASGAAADAAVTGQADAPGTARQDNEPVAGPAVKPVVIGEDTPAAERKRGWWRR